MFVDINNYDVIKPAPRQGQASRSPIAGKLANIPKKVALWIQHPKSVKPANAMPEVGVTDAQASDMVAIWQH